MFCKSGILIFIFAENNYSIYAHTMLIKTPLLHQSSGPVSFLSLSLSLSLFFSWSPGAQRLSEFTFLPGFLRLSRRRSAPSPHREGTWGLYEQSKPRARGFIGFLHKPWIINLFLSTFFSVDSGPPDSGPLVIVKSLSHVWLFETPWTVSYQAPLSMGFSRQEYWSGLPFPSPGDLSNPRIEPGSPALQADALTSEPPGKPRTTTQKKLDPRSFTPIDTGRLGQYHLWCLHFKEVALRSLRKTILDHKAK